MKKLKLNLDDLKIESFETMPKITGRGTINGHASASCDCTDGCGGGVTGPATVDAACDIASVVIPGLCIVLTQAGTCAEWGSCIGQCASDDCTQPPDCANPQTFSCEIKYC